MAKVVITFEDSLITAGGSGAGTVVKCEPEIKTILKKWKRKEQLTPAESLAAIAMGAVAESSSRGELADRIRGVKNIIDIN